MVPTGHVLLAMAIVSVSSFAIGYLASGVMRRKP